MSILSFEFLLFLLGVVILYYITPRRMQWIVLLGGSIVFYMMSAVPYTFLYIVASVGMVYVATWYIERQEKKIAIETDKEKCIKLYSRKKKVYGIAVVVCVVMLAALKYTNFFLNNAKVIAGVFGRAESIPSVHWVSALGISFYTLQMVGYLTDVYWGIAPFQKNIAKLALFNSYFPQMISGPISRYQQVSEDMFSGHKFNKRTIYSGVLRIIIGFFKKLVVSEQLVTVTDAILLNPQEYGGIFIWFGMAMYVIQIYADFSGCMDIIMGASECVGTNLPENFKNPFSSVTIQEFWQRWHITLGAWLKDYIMYPILRSGLWNKFSRNIKKKWGKKAAKSIPTFTGMLILWLVMGLWHGGGWNYIGEGIWFWSVIVLGHIFENQSKKIKSWLKINEESRGWYVFRCIRTTFIYAVGALFFKAGTLKNAFFMIRSSLNPTDITRSIQQIGPMYEHLDSELGTTYVLWVVMSVCVGTAFMVLMGYIDKKRGVFRNWLLGQKPIVNIVVIYVMVLIIMFFGAYGPGYDSSEFIYGGF